MTYIHQGIKGDNWKTFREKKQMEWIDLINEINVAVIEKIKHLVKDIMIAFAFLDDKTLAQTNVIKHTKTKSRYNTAVIPKKTNEYN